MRIEVAADDFPAATKLLHVVSAKRKLLTCQRDLRLSLQSIMGAMQQRRSKGFITKKFLQTVGPVKHIADNEVERYSQDHALTGFVIARPGVLGAFLALFGSSRRRSTRSPHAAARYAEDLVSGKYSGSVQLLDACWLVRVAHSRESLLHLQPWKSLDDCRHLDLRSPSTVASELRRQLRDPADRAGVLSTRPRVARSVVSGQQQQARYSKVSIATNVHSQLRVGVGSVINHGQEDSQWTQHLMRWRAIARKRHSSSSR